MVCEGKVFAAGLDDEDLWSDFDFEDPLMAVVDAAMDCQASS